MRPTRKIATSSTASRIAGTIICLIVIFTAAGIIRFVFSDRGNGSISDQVQTALSSTDLQPFTSTAYGFQISFPNHPRISNQTVRSDRYSLPTTTYQSANDAGLVYL